MPVLLALATIMSAACAKQEPESVPAPVGAAVADAERMRAEIEAQTGEPVSRLTITYTEPPEDVFVEMVVAAARWSKGSIGARSIGIYQMDNAPPRFRRAIEAVTQRYAFRPIMPSDFAVVCGGNAASRTSITSRNARCSMKYVDAVIVFNSVYLMRDSGYVGLNVTRVPTGANRSERVYHCVTLARKGANEWDAKRSERIVDANRCPRRIP